MNGKIIDIFVCILLVGTFFVVSPELVRAPQDGDYTYTVSGGVATITGYIGSGGAIMIPSTLGGYPTVHIGDSAFYYCLSITSVIIPNSVTTIGSSFSECHAMTSVTIPNSVTSIGDDAFNECYSLISVNIPDSVFTIGNRAFNMCISLASMTIGNSVDSIGEEAFSNCESLTSVTIPDSLWEIGNSAFNYCRSLTSIDIPENVYIIGSYVFFGCYSLTAINVNTSNEHYASINGVLYNKDRTTLICCPSGKNGNFIIPSSVVIINNGAFAFCSSLISVFIPDNVISIGDNAFEACVNLTSIDIPDRVITIGNYAFQDCEILGSIIIGNSVTTIGHHAFDHCLGLSSVIMGNSVTIIKWHAFNTCVNLHSLTMGKNVTVIESRAFESCYDLASITFLGLVAPAVVSTEEGEEWIYDTSVETIGHAYAASNFPPPGSWWKGIKMGEYIPQPIANFTYSPSNPSSTDIIHFTDSSFVTNGTIVSWSWNFGDHYYSGLQNPIHCYYTNGAYNATLTVTDNDGGANTKTRTITIGNQGEILDQQQTQYSLNYAMYTTRWGGQSFKPTKSLLTSVDLYMRKIGSPPNSVILSVRSSLSGSDLVSLSKPASQIPTSYGWVKFDFSDLTVTPGSTYYLVLRTSGGSSSNCYYWGYGYQTPYTNGIRVYSTTGGSSWTNNPSYDNCFKTYGR